jgi:nicotinamidase-related amidase
MVVEGDAIVAIDFIKVFVTGRMGSPKFVNAARATGELIKKSGKFTILAQDSHNINDPEIAIWGPHAMEGTEEAETVPELIGMGEVIKKHTYDSFYGTNLERVLKGRGAKDIIFCGVVTDICVVHSVASAFFRGFSPIVVEECTDTYSQSQKRRTLEYMKKNYGAKVISLSDILAK